MPDAQTQVGQRSPARRTIVKGAAWAVPAVTFASAAPALATSPIPPNGLNGWVALSRTCSWFTDWEFRIDGRGNFTGGGDNDRGIWTFVPDPNAVITLAEIIFYFNRGNTSHFTFTNESGPGWSNLTRYTAGDSAAPSGYYAYRTTYTGTWTYDTFHEAWVADHDPFWEEDDMPGNCGQICAYARRTITVNGTTVSFLRGPVCR